MTHGGLLGTLEAVHSGIPVIGIPFYFDQPRNILKLVEQGAGVLLEYETMTADTLYNAIITIINNSRLEYKQLIGTYLFYFNINYFSYEFSIGFKIIFFDKISNS